MMRGTATRAAASVAASPLLLGLALLAAPAAAQPFPQSQICTEAGADQAAVDPLRLVQWLLGTSRVSDAALDTDRDGNTLLSEKQLALAHPDYCSEVATGCTADDAAALRELHDELARFVATEGGGDYRFERLRRPSVEERRSARFLDPALAAEGQEFQIGEVLDVERRFVEIACVEPPAAAPADPIAADPGREILGWRANPERTGGFRLTSDIDDLNKSREQLLAVRPAELNISSNLRDDETRFQIKAVAGYDFELRRSPTARSSIIPLIQLERFFEGSTERINKLAIGAQTAFVWGSEATGSDELAATPLYITDTDLEGRIGSFKLRWTPTPSSSATLPVNFERTYGPLVVNLPFDALSNAGRVFEQGDNPDLEDASNFWRFGARLGLRLRGAAGTALQRFQLDVSERYLLNIGDGPADISRFDVTLSYLFPESDNYRIALSYSKGRDEDTLQKVNFWTTTLGIRF